MGFLPGDPLNLGLKGSNNDVWHWFKHTYTFLGDIPHTLTVEEYVRLGKELGQRAARNEAGTCTKIRYRRNSAGGFDVGSVGQFDVLVYWERQTFKPGLFMVVQPSGRAAGLIATLFSPKEGKSYFDSQETGGPSGH